MLWVRGDGPCLIDCGLSIRAQVWAARQRGDDLGHDGIVRQVVALHGDVGLGVNGITGFHQPAHGALGVFCEQRPVVAPKHAAQQQCKLSFEPHGDTGLADAVAGFRYHEGAAARCQYLRTRAQQAGDDLALAFAEVGLAVILEDVGDGFARRALNLFIGVKEGQIEAGGQATSHRRFAAARHAHEHDRARAKVRADRPDSFRLRPFAFASCTESDHLWRVSPLSEPPPTAQTSVASFLAAARSCAIRVRQFGMIARSHSVRHNGVTLSLDHTGQGATSLYAKPFPISRGSGDRRRGCLWRTLRHAGIFRARTEGDGNAGAGGQGASLTDACASAGGRKPMRAVGHIAALSGALLGLVADSSSLPAVAQASWNPFKANSARRPRASDAAAPQGAPGPLTPEPREPMRGAAPAPMAQQPTAPWVSPRGGSVERSELAPILATDGTGLPLELWRGLDLKAVEELLAGLDLPPRSPAVHQLWRRMLLASAAPPAGSPTEEHFVALRLEALYRSGLLAEMEAVLSQAGVAGPVVQMLRARRDIGLGRREIGCQGIAALAAPSSGLPDRLKGETQLLSGYCAAAGGDAQAAALAADLAREEGVEAELPLAVLIGFAGGTKPKLTLPARMLLLDYRFLELLGPVDAAQVFDRAEPALISALAADSALGGRVRIAAAEAALGLNALAPELMAQVYRRTSLTSAGGVDPGVTTTDPALRHALYFQAIEAARPGTQKARFLRAILEDARKRGAYLQMARVLAPLIADLAITPDALWFAETALETELIAGRFELARRWAEAASLRQWLALIDVADPERRGGRLASLAPIAQL